MSDAAGAPLRARLRACRLIAHRARCTGWGEHAAACAELLRAVHAPLPAPAPGASLTVVFPQHGRLANAELAAWLALACPAVARVVVVNDNPAEKLRRWLSLEDPRLVLIDHPRAVGPVCRYLTARDQPGTRFISVDDDLFLSPRQLEALAAALEREPDRAHGVYGQRYLGPGRGFLDNVVRAEGSVDVLNRAYAFTRDHLETYLGLLDTLGVRGPAALMELDDDIPLSFVGQRRPRCHDLGAFCDCPSEHSSAGARWRRDRARSLRTGLYERLLSLRGPSRQGDEAARPKAPVWPRSLAWALALAPTGLPLLVPAVLRARTRNV